MNQYQLEVASLDQKHRRRMRVLTFIGAAALAIAVLWGAGVPLTGWFKSPSAPRKPAQTAETSIPTPTPAPINAPPTSREVPPSMLAGTDTSISKAPLVLLLVSTSPGRNIREGTAAIGVVRENPQTYMSGALLANGARLREIHKDYVVLERDGRSVRLYVEASKNSGTNELLLVGGPQATKPVVVNSSEPFTDYLRPNPIYEGEILRGYEVYPGQRTDIFSQMGLQGGDVITSLNNMPLSDPAGALERFQQLMTGVAMIATVERKGESKTLTLDGALIRSDQERAKSAPAMPMAGMNEP